MAASNENEERIVNALERIADGLERRNILLQESVTSQVGSANVYREHIAACKLLLDDAADIQAKLAIAVQGAGK